MKILFLGDVMGRAGRKALETGLAGLRARFSPDVVVLNAENAAAGRGVTLKIAQAFFALGVDVLTSGNHIWNQKDMVASIEGEPRILRPLNYPEGTPGRGFFLHQTKDGQRLLVLNVMGHLFMNPTLDDPFATTARFLEGFHLGVDVQAIFVDFHAEATSEKMAFGHFLDGRVSAVVGTHTHVPTADAHILRAGTAYQTDAGMCGDFDSVIGMRKEGSLWRFLRKIPGEKMEPAEGEGTLCGCFIETNDKTGLASKIESFQIGGALRINSNASEARE